MCIRDSMRAESGSAPARGGSAFGKSLDLDDDIGPPGRMVSNPNLNRMDGVGLSPQALPVRMAPSRYGAKDAVPGASTARLRERLRGPLKLVALGIAIMAADFGYSQYSGELFAVGDVRPLWVAGPLVIAGIFTALMRIMQGTR